MEPWTIIESNGSAHTLQEDLYEILIRIEPCPQQGPSRITVEQKIPFNAAKGLSRLLELSHWNINTPTCAMQVHEIDASDDAGHLKLSYFDEGEDTGCRYWYPSRNISGRLHFSYNIVPTNEISPRGAAPPLDLRAEEGAVSGCAGNFLIHPPAGTYKVVVHWDLSSISSRAHGLCSILEKGGRWVDMEELTSCYFMGGNIGVYPELPDGSGFCSAWQGSTPFSPTELLSWTKKLYEHYKVFFGGGSPGYCVFVRRNKVNAGGGVALLDSFVQTYDTDHGNNPAELKLTLAHEMFHTFQPTLSSPGDNDTTEWFEEGSAVFYELALPFRFNMIESDAFLNALNYYAGRYYTNVFADIPNSEVNKGFWKDTRIRTIPYDRGFFYFATVDDAMRKSSNGKKSLDTLIYEMLGLHKKKPNITLVDWKNALKAHLGDNAVKCVDDMLKGSVPLPSSDAFGSRFERVSKPLRRYELGFEPAVLAESPRIVRGLISRSAAERAGVRNGDKIVKPVPQDAIQGEQDGILTLQLHREKQEFTISYKPRGEEVPAWQWQVKEQAENYSRRADLSVCSNS